MDNDTLSLYESLVSFDTPRELRKAYRSLLEAGEDGLLSDGYYALKRPYKDARPRTWKPSPRTSWPPGSSTSRS